MPWTYGQEGIDLVKHFFRLRYQLIPYIYTYSRIASDSALPIMQPLYLEYPKLEQAYAHPSEYFFGKEILVAPILDLTGEREVYLPPGEWFADFTDSIYTGPRVLREKHGLHTLPVFVRSGSIVPMQHPREYSDQGPLDTLLLDVYGTGSAHFNLYEDDGVSLGYRRGEYAWTSISGWPKASRGYLLEINPTHGRFAGQVSERTYEMRFHGFPQPKSVSMNGVKLGAGGYLSSHWSYNSGRSVLVVQVRRQSISRKTRVVLGW